MKVFKLLAGGLMVLMFMSPAILKTLNLFKINSTNASLMIGDFILNGGIFLIGLSLLLSGMKIKKDENKLVIDGLKNK